MVVFVLDTNYTEMPLHITKKNPESGKFLEKAHIHTHPDKTHKYKLILSYNAG